VFQALDDLVGTGENKLYGVSGEKVEETSCYFIDQSYLGLKKQVSGYGEINDTVRLRAAGISDGQIDFMRERCKKSSPANVMLTRSIPLNYDFLVE